MSALTRRYVVMTLATETTFDPRDPDGAFVLKPWKDPAALRALRAYRDNCFPELARDIDAWIRAIEAGPETRGDVGRRNERYLRPSTGARAAPGGKARAGGKAAPARKRASSPGRAGARGGARRKRPPKRRR